MCHYNSLRDIIHISRNPARLNEFKGVVLAFFMIAALAVILLPQATYAQDKEPIVASGHGGFFGQDGRQIPVTLDFVITAQSWYRDKLYSILTDAKKDEFVTFERTLLSGLKMNSQDRLIMQHQMLEWLLANVASDKQKLKIAGKLRALRYAMNWKIPEKADLKIVAKRERFTPNPDVVKRIKSLPIKGNDIQLLSVTTNSGQAYIDECAAAGVPIPPTINVLDPAGLTGWKSQGFIPTGSQFIIGTPAEVRTYQSTSPEGMCYALPRYTDSTLNTAFLDGVICIGKQSSKACFWDNQWTVDGEIEAFSIAAGEQIPIGVPNVPGGKYQAGGKEIEFGPGDICTDCHAGENPYIIHPRADLDPGPGELLWESLALAPQNLPSTATNRYDPIVASSWPQNQLSQAGSTVPAQCNVCHVKAVNGRFPHLSNELPGFCNTILPQAINETMPPGSPGSAATVANMFRNTWCGSPPNSDSADSGDPHITTTNGFHYDFQAAGEFTVLKNDDTGFELQTRQSPVLTSFTPAANPHTGLASCVSLNTAVALRSGKHRITYQPAGGAFVNAKGLELRIDGNLVYPSSGAYTGDGYTIKETKFDGELDIHLADGTRVVITPLFWSSQGYWYLDVQVFNTPAREGVMGPILASDWLPRAPDGTSFGPKPATLPERHIILNQKFADAWRVKDSTSLFDYAAGFSTADFTDTNWPNANVNCTSTTVGGFIPKIGKPSPELAKKACADIKDEAIHANCIFDVTVMGDEIAAKAHMHAEKIQAEAN